MNILLQSIIFSTFIWSLIYANLLFLIISLILAIHIFFQMKIKKKNQERFFCSNFYNSGCPQLKVRFEVNMEKIETFLIDYNKKNPLKKLTKSHIALKSIGEALKSTKNGYITFGNYQNNQESDICLIVNVDKINVSILKVHKCQKNSIKQIASQIKGKIRKIKTHENPDVKDQEKIFKSIPSFLIEISIWLIGFISYDLQKSWSLLKIKINHFGNNGVTNVSGFGCLDAVATHVPCAKSFVLLVLNGERDKVVFEDGRFFSRRVAWVNLTLDSRFGYGDGVLMLVEKIENFWKNFEDYL